MGKRALTVIEEGVIGGMAASDDYCREFPFLQQVRQWVATSSAGCQTCGSANTDRAEVFTAAKRAIAGLADDRLDVLKRMLNSEKVEITYRTASNSIQTVTR